MSTAPGAQRPPETVRRAGYVVTAEGTLAVLTAIVLVIRGAAGHDQRDVNGFATAAWFLILGGAVLLAGIALIRGRRWGRAIAVVAQLLLLPVAWALTTDSGWPVFGVPLGLAAIATLILLFSGSASGWMASDYVDLEQDTNHEIDSPAEPQADPSRRRRRK